MMVFGGILVGFVTCFLVAMFLHMIFDMIGFDKSEWRDNFRHSMLLGGIGAVVLPVMILLKTSGVM